jgi:hypothetical protein
MDTVWKIAVGAAAGLLMVWLVLIAALLLAGRRYERLSLGEMLRLLPDLLRLLKRLAGDKSLPRGVRRWLLPAGYLAVPIDLIPTSSRSSATPTTPSSSRWRYVRWPAAPGCKHCTGTGPARRAGSPRYSA